ncbi:MAG: hypothetical protein ABI310_04695, partial [Microbacteriaceae bacterium]
GENLLTDKQRARLDSVFAIEEHVEVEATWRIYQRMIAAYREVDKAKGKQMMQALIDSVTSGVPAELIEVRRLEQLRGSALGFRNLADCIAYAGVRISDGMSPSGLC